MALLHLEIVTPKGSVLDAEVDGVSLPGRIGEFSVLEGHIPMLAGLKPGVVTYGGKRLAVGGGFAEVEADNKVLVLVDNHAFPDDIDSDDVKEQLREAEDDLKGWAGEIELLDQESDEWKETPEHVALLERIAWIQAQIESKK